MTRIDPYHYQHPGEPMPISKPAIKPKAKPSAQALLRALEVAPQPLPVKAPEILTQAQRTIAQRGAQRDSGQGQERSMAATVAAFNAIEGTQLTERQGWAFMKTLKMVRAATTARNGLFNPDDALDGAAYAALEGEAAAAAHAAQLLREGGAQ